MSAQLLIRRQRAAVRGNAAGLVFLTVVLALLLAVPAAAQDFPQLTGRVVDQANLLSPEQELDLQSKSAALEAQSGRQFVVATVPSLGGIEIEDYGTRLGREWGIGREGEDDGVILLVAPTEKKVRIETGYGAEGFLPDILAGRIIRNQILPRFRQGDMAGGIMAGSNAVLQQMSVPAEEAQRNIAAAEQQQRQTASGMEGVSVLPVIIMVIIFFSIIGSLSRRARGRRYRRRHGISPWVVLWGINEMSRASRHRGGWGSGGFGGGGFGGFGGGGFGGFSGGGGGFGGGGASGGW